MNQSDELLDTKVAPFVGGCASPPCVRRFASALLDQQMWCWGRDIRRREGNVLLQYGFRRWRPPEGTLGSTAYQLDVPPSRQAVLWGFGLFYADGADGGLYLKRFTFAPLWCPNPDLRAALWRPEDVPEFQHAEGPAERRSLRRLLSGTLRWIAEYESWVLTTLGLEYRRRCLLEWSKTVTEAETMPGQWLLLAQTCLEYLECGVPSSTKER